MEPETPSQLSRYVQVLRALQVKVTPIPPVLKFTVDDLKFLKLMHISST